MGARSQGRCLCGAVTVNAMLGARLRACHCEMCRRHCSGPFFSVETVGDSAEVTGPVQVFGSSPWAERAFCSTCGSTLWYATLHDKHRNFSAGLFEDAGGATLDIEFFADSCPQGYALAGNHQKLTTTETIALFAPDEGDAK
ncbi:GFA family protein [uncultured Sulfitobacter sp.]|uniref:GFA family protein n=1 Tax=uncultured Sulfitobacter sp. TaxID=191468 RepID=UPI002625B96A|nr:GFA family protein [uncultured Sulfitobacter sp.]